MNRFFFGNRLVGNHGSRFPNLGNRPSPKRVNETPRQERFCFQIIPAVNSVHPCDERVSSARLREDGTEVGGGGA